MWNSRQLSIYCASFQTDGSFLLLLNHFAALQFSDILHFRGQNYLHPFAPIFTHFNEDIVPHCRWRQSQPSKQSLSTPKVIFWPQTQTMALRTRPLIAKKTKAASFHGDVSHSNFLEIFWSFSLFYFSSGDTIFEDKVGFKVRKLNKWVKSVKLKVFQFLLLY